MNIYRATAADVKIKMLLYGSPGVGKTTLALTCNDHPSLGPALVLNFEGGLLSVVGRGDVDAVDIRQMADLEQMFWLFQEGNPAVVHYKTVIVDSGSELYNKALRESVEANLQTRRNRKGTVDDIQIEDYGKAGAMVFRLFSMFRDLPLHVIVTAHARITFPQGTDTNNTQPTDVRPAFSPGIASRIEGIFDFVHFMYTFDEQEAIDDETTITIQRRALLTRTMGAYHAKTRGPRFAQAVGDTILDPLMPLIYETLLKTEGQGGHNNGHGQDFVSDPDSLDSAVWDPKPSAPDPQPETEDPEIPRSPQNWRR